MLHRSERILDNIPHREQNQEKVDIFREERYIRGSQRPVIQHRESV